MTRQIIRQIRHKNSSGERKGAATGNEDTPASNNVLETTRSHDGWNHKTRMSKERPEWYLTNNPALYLFPEFRPYMSQLLGHPQGSRVQERKRNKCIFQMRGGNQRFQFAANSPPSISRRHRKDGRRSGPAGGASGVGHHLGAQQHRSRIARKYYSGTSSWYLYRQRLFCAMRAAGMVGNSSKLKLVGFIVGSRVKCGQ